MVLAVTTEEMGKAHFRIPARTETLEFREHVARQASAVLAEGSYKPGQLLPHQAVEQVVGRAATVEGDGGWDGLGQRGRPRRAHGSNGPRGGGPGAHGSRDGKAPGRRCECGPQELTHGKGIFVDAIHLAITSLKARLSRGGSQPMRLWAKGLY